MKHRLAIWYHAKLSGGIPAVTPYVHTIMVEQMDLLVTSGIYDAANLITLGVNNSTLDSQTKQIILPGAQVQLWGDAAESELPTMWTLQQWLPGHDDWYVLYFHAKGCTHGTDPLNVAWRRCMEQAVIKNWPRCIADLDRGYDAVGAHWLTPQQYPGLVKSPFFGGNFWWAKASFLLKLPPLPKQPKNREDFFIAENWIGLGPVPQVADYRPHWPGLAPCSAPYQDVGSLTEKLRTGLEKFHSCLPEDIEQFKRLIQ